ncbi:MAG TPA: thioesterase family protein [Burkholderiales bacterium]
MSESQAAGAPAAASHPFDQAIALEPLPDGRLRGHTHEAYWNMVSPFGGVTAAIALNGLMVQRERIGDPVSLTVNFVAAIQPGEFFVVPRLIRSNRSTQHWALEILQGGAVTTSAIAFFGVRRPTWSLTEAAPPSVPPPEAGMSFRPPSEVMRWPSAYNIRYLRGRVREENPDSLTYNWISDSPPRPVDFPALVAYADAFAPRLFLRRPHFVPVATVSLNVYFHADAAEVAAQGTDPVLGVAQGQVFHKGYFDQEGQLWGRGRLLATTQQIVWFKE